MSGQNDKHVRGPQFCGGVVLDQRLTGLEEALEFLYPMRALFHRVHAPQKVAELVPAGLAEDVGYLKKI